MQHDDNALLFDFHKPTEMLETVCRLLDDAALRNRLGKAARQTIVNNYDLNTICLPQQMAILDQLGRGELDSVPHVPTHMINVDADA
jgi:glycosyltransferase involved in cell wall biosynthesis